MQVLTIYKHSGEWCYSLVIDGEFDHSDTLDVDPEATKKQAIQYAYEKWPEAEVKEGE